ncbi:MAG: histidine kinase [Blastocatellia bacterium]
MESLNAASLVNALGFTVGIALYGLLGLMILWLGKRSGRRDLNLLLLTTAILGLVWNIGELLLFVQRDFGYESVSPFLTAAAYSALGFLPSVVVHSAQSGDNRSRLLSYGAYGLSSFASILHFVAAFMGEATPSDLALRTLTFGSLAMALGLLVFNFRETLEKKAIWSAALLVFAVSALHLSGKNEESSWIVELVAHQSSLPLALVILHQNYRFAFADLFLKRAISLLLLSLVAFGLYVSVAAPLLRYHETHGRNDMQAISLILTLWIATALIYPKIHKSAVWLVDKVILHRSDYAKFQFEIARMLESCEASADVLNSICTELRKVLTAGEARWEEFPIPDERSKFVLVDIERDRARIYVQTAEQPHYVIHLGDFFGGRRLLSDETAMLESVSLIAARRIDALRVSHERCELELREQEFSKLATEAQLTALRSQINPHFLFNALTTIGYLIQTSPDKAFQTLLHLTKLLRGVLSSTGEFSTLGAELKLIESYLDIERARFEERLKVTIDVPEELESIHIPSLILQPLVENAIKHGISENRNGGQLTISAVIAHEKPDEQLELTVFDSGSGKKQRERADSPGLGLANIRQRLATYYGGRAALTIETTEGVGTRSGIRLPVHGNIDG